MAPRRMSRLMNRGVETRNGVEKGGVSRPALVHKSSNIPLSKSSKVVLQSRTTRAAAVSKKANTASTSGSFDIYLDENSESEFNVIKQLEKLDNKGSRVPLSTISEDRVQQNETLHLESPSPSDYGSMGEESVYHSTHDVLSFHVFDTPSDLVEDMYIYMRERESMNIPRLRWHKQPELTETMRLVLIDWLSDVVGEFSIESECLHLAVSMIDRVLMMCEVSRPNLQLLGTAALMIATKYELIYPPELKDFVYVTDDSYTDAQIMKMERKVLDNLRFDVSVPTSQWFLSHFINMLRPSEVTDNLAHYLCDLSLMELSIGGHRPSIIAASCMSLSNLMTGSIPWSKSMEEKTCIKVDELSSTMDLLLNSFRQASRSDHKSLYERYSTMKMNQVSTLPCPDSIPSFN